MLKIKHSRRVSALAASALLLSLMAGCNRQQSPDQLLAQAQQYHQKGDNQAAVIQLKNVLAIKADHAEARLLLGEVYLEQGDAASAEKELRRALALGLARERALPPLARALLLQAEFQKVLDETAEPAAQKSPVLMALRGEASLELKQFAEAQRLFDAALQAEPGQPQAVMGLARLSLQRGDQAAANRDIAQATEQHPKSAELWLFKAQVARSQGKPDEAKAALDKLLAINPNHVDARLMKATILIEAKQYDAAKAELAAARKAKPDYLMISHTQAMLDFTQGRYAEAKESLQKVLAIAPDHIPTVMMAGATEYALGAMPLAERHLKKVLEFAPGELFARKLLASVYASTGRPKEALALLEPNLADSKDAQLLKIAGRSALELRDFAQASGYLDRASKLDPEAAELHTALGMSRLGQGDVAAALVQLQMATKLDDKSIDAGVGLAGAQLRAKQYDNAVATLQALQKQHPTIPLLPNMEGGVLLMQNKPGPARASFEKALQLRPDYYTAVASLAQLDVAEKKPEAAQARLTAYLDKNKGNTDAMLGLAALAAARQKPDEVTQWLERAQAAQPKSAALAIRLARHYLAINDKAKALTLARNAQVINPDQPELLDLLAQVQLASQDKNGALESYSKLVALAPESALWQYKQAGVYDGLGNKEAAIASLKKAIKLQPDFLDAQLALADLEKRGGNVAYGLELARRLQAGKRQVTGLLLEGDMELARGKAAQAAQAYAGALQRSPQAPILIKLTEALRRAGKGQEAQERMLAWTKAHPSDMLVGLALSESYIASQRYPQASEELARLLVLQPNNAAVLNDQAWVYLQTGDARALALAEQAYKLAGDSPAILDTLGWILVERGQAARGVPLLQKAAAAQPESIDIRLHLAKALVKAKDTASARRELEHMLTSGKDFPRRDEALTLLRTL